MGWQVWNAVWKLFDRCDCLGSCRPPCWHSAITCFEFRQRVLVALEAPCPSFIQQSHNLIAYTDLLPKVGERNMGHEATSSTAVAAVACIVATWTWTAVIASAATGVSASDQQPASAFPSWSSRAWNVYQRYYRETASATENANKGHHHWGRLLGMIADDRYQKRNDDISTSSTRGDMCHSPFGIDERDRITECFGEDSVVMASYDSDVKFATSILSTLNALGGDDLSLFDEYVSQTGLFEFSVHHHYDEAGTTAALDNESALSVPEEDAVVVNDNTQLSATESVSTSPANISPVAPTTRI